MHGAKIDVYSDPGRTNLVDSQTADMGSAIISTPAGGHYYVRIARDRFITLEDEANFNCGGTQGQIGFDMTPDPAYVCCSGCAVPIKKTLSLSGARGGATLTYGDYEFVTGGLSDYATGWLGRGTLNFTPPASGPWSECPAIGCDALYFWQCYRPGFGVGFLANTQANEQIGQIPPQCPGNDASYYPYYDTIDGMPLVFLRTTGDYWGMVSIHAQCDPYMQTMTAVYGFTPLYAVGEILILTES
jgi:hypothetical protein